MMPRNKKCAVNLNYCMTSWKTPSDIIQLSPEEEVNSGGSISRRDIWGGGSVYLVLYEPTLRGIVVLVFTKSVG